MILAYSDKELYTHLKRKKIIVEMYASNWVTTLFTRVVDFSLLYEMWEIFLFERDKYLIFYFAVGLLITHREEILQLNSIETLLKCLNGLQIEGFAKMAVVYSNTI